MTGHLSGARAVDARSARLRRQPADRPGRLLPGLPRTNHPRRAAAASFPDPPAAGVVAELRVCRARRPDRRRPRVARPRPGRATRVGRATQASTARADHDRAYTLGHRSRRQGAARAGTCLGDGTAGTTSPTMTTLPRDRGPRCGPHSSGRRRASSLCVNLRQAWPQRRPTPEASRSARSPLAGRPGDSRPIGGGKCSPDSIDVPPPMATGGDQVRGELAGGDVALDRPHRQAQGAGQLSRGDQLLPHWSTVCRSCRTRGRSS